jgi:1-acyl-sn-glycerol-3-phosphate acyltransferase
MRLLRSLLWGSQAVFTAAWSAFWIVTALAICTLVRSRRPGLFLARRVWAPGILKSIGARLEVVGAAEADLSRPCFFAANHQSWLDIPAIFAALPVPVLFIAKQELSRIPFLGWFMKGMGMVLIDRADRKEAVRSIEAVAERLREGWSLLSFPEGTRSADGRVQCFKTASFAAAVAAGAPIVPIALEGAGRVMPRDTWKITPGTIRLALGAPISTAGLDRDDRAELARRAQQAVESLLAELRQETAAVAAVPESEGLLEA